MELDSIWDEGFFSMVSDELDYEFDETDPSWDLFKIADELLQDKNKLVVVKQEKNEPIANCKDEPPKFNNLLYQPKLILKRLPNSLLCNSVRTKLKLIKPKVEIIDQKPDIYSNLLNARIVLKRLTDKDMKPLLNRVKTEVKENIADRLRSQDNHTKSIEFVQRYCFKCKITQIDYDNLHKIKNCQSCNNQLIYLCTKCNKKHYVNYDHLKRHCKTCCSTGETKVNFLGLITLYRCADCNFKTTYIQSMTSHLKRKRHTIDSEFDNSSVAKSKKVKVKRKGTIKIPCAKYSKFIVKQNGINITELTERYCNKCNKPSLSMTREPRESCLKCNKLLHLRCLKCGNKYSRYDTIQNHLRSKCYPQCYRCTKCEYINSNWSLMQHHVMEQHDKSKLSVKVENKTTHGNVFYCKLCSFQTKYKQSWTKHMVRVHK